MSPVFLKMFETEMVETGEGVLAVEDMSGESMEQLLKHIYTGSTDNFKNLKVENVLELLNASNKVKSSRITRTSPFEWIRSSSINLFFAFVIYTV
jgi:citrate lyase beta subunit